MPSSSYQNYILPAQKYPQLWRLFFGIFLIAVIYIAWTILVLSASYFAWGYGTPLISWLEDFVTEPTPTSSLSMLITIVGFGMGTFAAVSLLHNRSPGTLFGPTKQTFKDFLLTAWVVSTGYMILQIILLLFDDVTPNLDFRLWLNFLPLALFVLLLQTGSEEVLFRGYLQQQLAARFQATWVSILLPSVLFGLLHIQPNDDSFVPIFYFTVTALFGLVAADLTRVTGSLGAAWGFHFANNTMAALLFSIEDSPLSGLALYTSPLDKSSMTALALQLLPGVVVVIMIWAGLRTWFKHRRS